ncbi:MAG TPA: hypothetical protein VK327_05100 [Candidatus Paceibacterota bacterium]|nr:hypothetical protein [Candidatus Paceibacterota bacterium]
MNTVLDSVYPDLLKQGLGRLGLLDARRELLALFSALEHFRRDLHNEEEAAGILGVSHRYISGLNLFRASGFWLVNSADMGFEPTAIVPGEEQSALQAILKREIKSGRFAWALRQDSPVFFQIGEGENGERGLLHSMSLSSQVVGMFCGVLNRELAPSLEIHFSLLSLLLGGSADALANLRKTAQLTSEIKTLSGLLPVCAWCKKVRDDGGYWEQIEKYIASRTKASFTHGICPDCKNRFFTRQP